MRDDEGHLSSTLYRSRDVRADLMILVIPSLPQPLQITAVTSHLESAAHDQNLLALDMVASRFPGLSSCVTLIVTLMLTHEQLGSGYADRPRQNTLWTVCIRHKYDGLTALRASRSWIDAEWN